MCPSSSTKPLSCFRYITLICTDDTAFIFEFLKIRLGFWCFSGVARRWRKDLRVEGWIGGWGKHWRRENSWQKREGRNGWSECVFMECFYIHYLFLSLKKVRCLFFSKKNISCYHVTPKPRLSKFSRTPSSNFCCAWMRAISTINIFSP